jgi:hypothetical protein
MNDTPPHFQLAWPDFLKLKRGFLLWGAGIFVLPVFVNMVVMIIGVPKGETVSSSLIEFGHFSAAVAAVLTWRGTLLMTQVNLIRQWLFGRVLVVLAGAMVLGRVLLVIESPWPITVYVEHAYTFSVVCYLATTMLLLQAPRRAAGLMVFAFIFSMAMIWLTEFEYPEAFKSEENLKALIEDEAKMMQFAHSIAEVGVVMLALGFTALSSILYLIPRIKTERPEVK